MNPWLIGGFFILTGATLKGFERDAAREIAAKLEGDQKQVSINVTYPGLLSPAIGEIGVATISASKFRTEGLPFFTEPKRSQKGTVKELRLKLTDFYLRDLHCDSFTASIPNCRFDFALARSKRKIRLSRSGIGPGEVRILIKDLAPFILKKYPEIQEVTVEPEGEKVRVKGRGQFLILNASFDILARVGTDGATLRLEDCRIMMNGEKPDQASEQALINALNPVIDFAKDLDLLDAVRAERVQVINNAVIVSGQVKIPEMPN
ncbi:MAG: hypothetical protein QE269_06705 [Fimbriimonas sp.]|nr:hypothetical protein [Fimbriimonas sp.]